MAIGPCRPGGLVCRAVPCLPRAAPCRRAGRAVPSPCLVPGVWPKARPAGRRAGPKARRATGPRSCQASSRPIFFLFRISRLHFLTDQSKWIDGPTYLYFLFFRIKKNYIFYWAIKHRAVGPCLSRATSHGGTGTARCLGPCRARAGPKCRVAGRANGPRAAWPTIRVSCTAAGSSLGYVWLPA